jgi:hypothetical protein
MGLLAGLAILVVLLTGPAKLSKKPIPSKWSESLV